jgi:predicted RNase H-like HicB family nuclease
MLGAFAEQSPDYWTQGKTREELEDNLKDILAADAGELI